MATIPMQTFTQSSTPIEMKVVMYSHLLCGNYFKAFQSKTASIILRLYCFSITIVALYFSSVAIFNFPLLYASWIAVFEVTISFMVSQFTSQTYLIRFITRLSSLDSLTGFKVKFDIFNILLFFAIILIHVMGTVEAFSVKILPINVAELLSLAILWFATQLRYCKSGIIIRLMHLRLKWLKKYLEHNIIQINTPRSIENYNRKHFIRKCVFYYDNILDALDAHNKFLQYEIIMTCALLIPKYVLLIHPWICLYVENRSNESFNIVNCFTNCLEMVIIYSPCTIMHLCKSATGQIKKTLVLHIINCSDVSLREELENLLQHITRRPFQLTLLRAVPVDLYIPITIATTTVTYTIVLLQFTHFGKKLQ